MRLKSAFKSLTLEGKTVTVLEAMLPDGCGSMFGGEINVNIPVNGMTLPGVKAIADDFNEIIRLFGKYERSNTYELYLYEVNHPEAGNGELARALGARKNRRVGDFEVYYYVERPRGRVALHAYIWNTKLELVCPFK